MQVLKGKYVYVLFAPQHPQSLSQAFSLLYGRLNWILEEQMGILDIFLCEEERVFQLFKKYMIRQEVGSYYQLMIDAI